MQNYIVPILTHKFIILSFTTVSCAFSALSYAADVNNDLLDLLLRKGIISQEEYADQKNKSANQDMVMQRINENDGKRPTNDVAKESVPAPEEYNVKKDVSKAATKDTGQNLDLVMKQSIDSNVKRPIIGVAKEGEPEPVVTLFGIADVGIAHVTHSKPFSSNFPSTVKTDDQPLLSYQGGAGMINGGMQDSRWGIRANLDLGDHRKAFATLESGINISTGELNDAYKGLTNGTKIVSGNSSLNGQLFGRQAFVGLSDPKLGSIAFGRQYNQIFDVLVEYDPVFKSDLFSPLGLSGTMGGGGGISENSRLDNSIKYQVKSGPLNFSTLYKFGGGAMADPTSGYVFNAGYTKGNFGVQAVYEQFYDALRATASTAPNVFIYDTAAYLLTGKYKVNDLTLKAGFEHYAAQASTNPASAFSPYGVSYAGTQVSSITNGAAQGVEQPTDITFVGGDYNFTQKFNLALGLYSINQHAYAAGKDKDGSAVGAGSDGIISWEALVADYKLNKYLDTYAGLSSINFGGTRYATGSTKAHHNFVSAVGLRFRF